ncbi:MAG: hypothetical protein JNM63_00230, partial [Spirochaetia bacterium]|nr:hypothetical protein [Spirochaetia bacterium]
VDEPAVAMTMLINEQTIFFEWKENTSPTPPSIRAILVKRYNDWLIKKYKDRAGVEKAWRSDDGKSALQADEDPAKGNVVCWESYVSILGQNLKEGPTDSVDSPLRTRTLVRFLKELQRDHYVDMLAYLKSLGLKVPIAGSNILSDVADLETTLVTEWTSQNRYYEHVRIVDKSYGFPNIPEVYQNPLSGPLVQPGIAATKINPLPASSTEHDTMWPQEWRSTHNLSVYASAALQDWDAIFWYCFMGGYGLTFEQAEKMTSIPFPTVEFNDPALAGLLPTAALMYLRRDVAPAKNLVQVIHASPMTDAVKSRITSGDFPFNYLTWVSRVEGVFGAQDGRAHFTVGPEEKNTGKNFMKMNADTLKRPGPDLARDLDADLKKNGLVSKDLGLQEGRITSDTGEVTRDWKRGLLLIDTPRTKAFSGFPVEPVRMGEVTFTLTSPFATIAVQSLENEPVGKAKKILLTAVARAENDKDVISYGQTVPNAKGGLRGERIMVTANTARGTNGRVLIENVDALISISGGDLKVTPIAADGSALEASFVVHSKDGRTEIPLGKSATIWYVCERI